MTDDYLRDLGYLLRQQALDAKARRDAAKGADKTFENGRLTAFHEVISLMQQQADAFGLSRDALGLQDLEPERDLL